MAFDRDQMVKVCGLFSSNNVNERAAAASKADKLLRAAGTSWDVIIAPPAHEQRLSLAFELQERGWPIRAAAGIASALNVPEPDKTPNIANWHGARWDQLLDWSNRSNNADYTTLNSQLNYLNYNLKGVYSGLAAKLVAAKTVAEAKKLFERYMGEDITKEVT